MLESVCGRNHKVKVTCLSVILKFRHCTFPRFEYVIFTFHVEVVIEYGKRGREVSSLKAIFDKIIEERFAIII
jgi:hypothetical protein